jgi:hypothetical protein
MSDEHNMTPLEANNAERAKVEASLAYHRKKIRGLIRERSVLWRAFIPLRNEAIRAETQAKRLAETQANHAALIALHGDGGWRSFSELVVDLCIDLRLDVAILYGRCRVQPYPTVRHYLFWLLKHNGVNPTAAGRLIGGKDHATAIYGAGEFGRRIGCDTLHRAIIRKYKFVRFTDDFTK